MDSIGDFLTIIRNAVRAEKLECFAPFSRMRLEIARILKNAGYIDDVKEVKCECGLPMLRLELRYVEGVSAITGIERISKPGCRIYSAADKLPRVLNGMGIAIVSTSQGLMRDSEARRKNVGGELLCKVW